MKTMLKLVLLALTLLAMPRSGVAQVTTVGGKNTPTGATIPVKVAPDGSIATAGSATYAKTGAPSFSVAVSTVSAASTGLTAGGCYRLACTSTVFWRTGTGTPVALTTDNPFFGPATEAPWCLPATDTAAAFVTAAGTGTCTGTAVARTP